MLTGGALDPMQVTRTRTLSALRSVILRSALTIMAIAMPAIGLVILAQVAGREPHHVAFHLTDLVKGFHSYYTRYKHSEKVISADATKTAARLFLVSCLKAVLGRGLSILGVSAPDEMHYEGDDEQS